MESQNANKSELEKKIVKEIPYLPSYNHRIDNLEKDVPKRKHSFLDTLLDFITIIGSTSGSIFCYYDFMIARRKRKSAELEVPYKSEPIDKDYS